MLSKPTSNRQSEQNPSVLSLSKHCLVLVWRGNADPSKCDPSTSLGWAGLGAGRWDRWLGQVAHGRNHHPQTRTAISPSPMGRGQGWGLRPPGKGRAPIPTLPHRGRAFSAGLQPPIFLHPRRLLPSRRLFQTVNPICKRGACPKARPAHDFHQLNPRIRANQAVANASTGSAMTLSEPVSILRRSAPASGVNRSP